MKTFSKKEKEGKKINRRVRTISLNARKGRN